MAPGPQNRNLNLLGQGLRRISGLRNLEVRFGSWNIGSFCGKGTEEYEELKKRKVDACCLEEERWRKLRARFFGVKGKRYKMRWRDNNDGIVGIAILEKELHEEVVKVRRKSNSAMALVLVFEEEAMRVI